MVAGGSGRRSVPAGVIAMVHLPPLPGSPRWRGDMEGVVARAVRDAEILAAGGVDAVLVENFGDAPFHATEVEPVTVAAMTRAVSAVAGSVAVPVGVNVLRNDALAGLAVAAATGSTFLRVNVLTGAMLTDQGWVEGQADRVLRDRERLAPDVALLADVFVKHATPPHGLKLEQAARDTWERGLADALVVTGPATGAAALPEELRRVMAAVPGAPVLVGSGVTPETVAAALDQADGVIVGSALMAGGEAGRPPDPDRVRRLVEAARR